MAIVSGTYQTFQAKGIREDLTNMIYQITPTKTPFMSAIPKVKATNTFHEWQTQDLAAVTSNAQIEGDDVSTFGTVTPTTRLGNYTQISTKNVVISGTNQSVKAAGRNNELGYQISMKASELKRDMEAALCSAANGTAGAVSNAANTATCAGSTSAARYLRGLEGWIATNVDLGASGVAPVYTMGSWAPPTDGTQRAFLESQVKSVLQSIYAQGGEPDMIMVGPSQKQTFSTFTGGSTRFDKSEDKSVTAAVDVYVSDFGTLQIMPNRFQRARTAFILETDKWALATLRPFETVDLAKTGDADKKLITVEYTLESRQEKASGAVKDLL
jgi:hypothetical protein